MEALRKPTIDAKTVFCAAKSRVRDVALRARADSAVSAIVAAEANYEAAANSGNYMAVGRPTKVGPDELTKSEMETFYTQRMAHDPSPARHHYDLILAGVRRCPRCGHRSVSTLDHHLPKAKYIDLVVTPLNLVPSCFDCNRDKPDAVPLSNDQVFLHPYFEDISLDPWLTARPPNATSKALIFEVSPPPSWPVSLRARVQYQFRELHLASLYSGQAADEVTLLRGELEPYLARKGPSRVQNVLMARARGASVGRLNSWQSAAFTAWSTNNWFYSGGFAC